MLESWGTGTGRLPHKIELDGDDYYGRPRPIVPVTQVYTLRVKPNFFPPLLHELVNYSDFAGCQVENSLANSLPPQKGKTGKRNFT